MSQICHERPVRLGRDEVGFGPGCADRSQARAGLVRAISPPSGHQRQKALGPAWGEPRPTAGGLLHETPAEDWLRDTPRGARGTGRTSRPASTFAEAAEEYLRFAEQDRGCKPSTIRGYRSQLNAHLLRRSARWRSRTSPSARSSAGEPGCPGPGARPVLSNRTKNHQLVLMHAIFRRAVKVYGLPRNPLANVDRYRVRASGDIEVFSPEEIWALVRAAGSDVDGTIFLTAAFTGLRRGELLGLRWRDIDFEAATIRVRASYAAGKLTTPKSGKVRAVPMAPDVAAALARIGQRDRFTGEDEFVFAGESGLPLNGDALSPATSAPSSAAGLRRLRFHDLRHTFGRG